MTPIVVTHILPSKTAFGATATAPAEAVFIPSKISELLGLTIGQEVKAMLVPNTMQPERTPWLAVRIEVAEPPAPVVPEPTGSIAEQVQRVMRDGGVWTLADMFTELFPGQTRTTSLTEYNAVSAALRSMFARGDCAKFQLWRSPDQTKAGREWFTCYPEKADVDEWVE
jgi:hypothetical protein